jgi:hypothetical protein
VLEGRFPSECSIECLGWARGFLDFFRAMKCINGWILIFQREGKLRAANEAKPYPFYS